MNLSNVLYFTLKQKVSNALKKIECPLLNGTSKLSRGRKLALTIIDIVTLGIFRHQNGIATWGKTRKGWFYGLKLHLTCDALGKILSFSLTPGNTGDRSQFMKLNRLLNGIFVADAGYLSEKLAREFYREHLRILFTKARANMKKIITEAQKKLYDSRAFIESVFRNLKMFDGLVSSLPRSVNGYLANYFYALAARLLA